MQKVCLGIEISQDGVKIALVEPERRHIIKIDAVPTSGNSIDDVSIYSSVLSSWVRSNLLPKINSIAVAFSSCNGVIRLVTVPKETESALNYVNWEFACSINSKASNYKTDIVFYPSVKKPERAIVTAMRKKIIESFCSVELEKSGFKPNYLMADVCALYNLLEYTEGLSGQPKCILKADEKFAMAFWGNETGPLAIRLLPKDNISPEAVTDILETGFKEFPKAKKNVKFCGELSGNAEFTGELARAAKDLGESVNLQLWNSLSKFSLEKVGDFSKLSQCMGAVGATLSYI
ncbi:MAG: hypothetical protein LBQ76_00695 [Candidatus Fibromonas sp.]|nr:hypothetical protein [Candidatus Fibromonas sp.]